MAATAAVPPRPATASAQLQSARSNAVGADLYAVAGQAVEGEEVPEVGNGRQLSSGPQQLNEPGRSEQQQDRVGGP